MARPTMQPASQRLSHPSQGKTPRVKISLKEAMGTLRRIWGYLSAFRYMLLLILVMVLISSVLGLFIPYFVGVIIDRLIAFDPYGDILTLMLLLGATYALNLVATLLQNYWMIGISQRTVTKMRADLFGQLQQMPIAFYNQRKHGELMSRLTNDIDNVSQTLNSAFIQITSSVLTFVGMVVMMLLLSPLLTLITLTIIPLMVFGMKWITARTGKYFKEQQRHLGELNGYIEEVFSGQRIVKTFSQEKQVITAFTEKNDRLKAAGYWAQTYSGFIPKLMNVLNNMSFAMIAGIGGMLAIQGVVSVGVIITFTEYARQFTRPLNDLANQFNTFLSAIAGAERVFEIIDEPVEANDEETAKELERVQGNIEFCQVSFAYEADEPTLQQVSFQVQAGQTVALVGPTGAGKSTIVQLLTRFYEVDEGRILIDGQPVTSYKRNSLRKHMGFVQQDPFLFVGTVRENIRYGKLTASDAEVEEAAKLANAHAFIRSLPNGYDTLIQPDAGSISHGQRQLLAIARTILMNPSVFVLDEATSSIDTITELKIQEALARLMKGRTSIVIAHRLNTIRHADQIFVVDQGRIVERGSHASLLQLKGHYYSMYQHMEQTKTSI